MCVPKTIASTSRAWRTCSISTPNRSTQRARVVCLDESPLQLIGPVREPIPAAPGEIERVDYEYRRNGTPSVRELVDVD
jgi:hypothetical protein